MRTLGIEEELLVVDGSSGKPSAAADRVIRRAPWWLEQVGGEQTGPPHDEAGGHVGPDDRLYVPVPATRGEPPVGGWPTGPDGEAEDADAEGDTFRLWSASLTDPSDVRDEELTVGSVAFSDQSMVWTDSTNGEAGQVHVRDLRTGDEHAFDPNTGERCNLLGFGATDERTGAA